MSDTASAPATLRQLDEQDVPPELDPRTPEAARSAYRAWTEGNSYGQVGVTYGISAHRAQALVRRGERLAEQDDGPTSHGEETAAMNMVVNILSPLDSGARERVIEWVRQRLAADDGRACPARSLVSPGVVESVLAEYRARD